MADAPKEVWIDYSPYTEGYAEVSETENRDTKYIRADIVEGERLRYQAAVDAGLFRIEQLEAALCDALARWRMTDE